MSPSSAQPPQRTPPRPRPRILLVEDDDARADLLVRWAPRRLLFVRAKSAAAAIGIILRDGDIRSAAPSPYAGVMLDHDLYEQPLNAADAAMDGKDVAAALARGFRSNLPVFIHSTNSGGSAAMISILRGRGFEVERCAMGDLRQDPSPLLEWLYEVMEIWDDARE
jgi:hypothetical protein